MLVSHGVKQVPTLITGYANLTAVRYPLVVIQVTIEVARRADCLSKWPDKI